MSACAVTAAPPAIEPIGCVPCVGCGARWGALATEQTVVCTDDRGPLARRVFPRGTALCMVCVTGCASPGGVSDVSGLTPRGAGR